VLVTLVGVAPRSARARAEHSRDDELEQPAGPVSREQPRFDEVARLRETQYPGRVGVGRAEDLPVATALPGKHLPHLEPALGLGRGTDERVARVPQLELHLDPPDAGFRDSIDLLPRIP